MSEDLKDLEEIIAVCRKNNIKKIKLPELELEFGGPEDTDAGFPEATQKLKFPDPNINMPTDEQLLNWSTPIEPLEEEKQNGH